MKKLTAPVDAPTREVPAWMTVEECADYLSLYPETVREFIRAGHLRAARAGDKPRSPYRIRREWADAYLEVRASGGLPLRTSPTAAPRRRAAARA